MLNKCIIIKIQEPIPIKYLKWLPKIDQLNKVLSWQIGRKYTKELRMLLPTITMYLLPRIGSTCLFACWKCYFFSFMLDSNYLRNQNDLRNQNQNNR